MSLQVLFGFGLAAIGLQVIAGLLAVLYSGHPAGLLVALGIPGMLLLALAGLGALSVGAAIAFAGLRRRP